SFGIEEFEIEENQANDIIDDESTKSTLKMAMMNMTNSIVGAGIISQAYSVYNCGIIGYILGLVILTVLVDWTIRLIIINSKLSGSTSYQEVCFKCFGKKGKILILLSQGLFAVGGAMAFCIIIGDTIPHFLKFIFKKLIDKFNWLNFFFERNFVIIMVTSLISYPLSLSRNISELGKASLLALLSMLVIVLIVLINGHFLIKNDLKGVIDSKWLIFIKFDSLFEGLSVISFALVCHHNSLFIYHSLKTPTLDRFTKLTHYSCFISLICCGLMGLGGFSIFRDKVKGNILNNFPSDDVLTNIARFCFGLNMLTTFPLEIFVVRDVIKDLQQQESFLPNNTDENDNQIYSDHELSDKQHFIITTVCVFLSMSVSLFTCNLGVMLEIVGSTTASLMAYIFPPLCYLKLTNNGNKNWKEKFPSYFTITFGFMIMFISTYQTIKKIQNDDEQTHCVE
ncbi:Avt2p ASCRUDRAFT_20566, partial [Ascoidea rubescens DSM 1968]